MKSIVYVVFAMSLALHGADASARTESLRVNHLPHPANVTVPTFSWKMESARQGAAQTAYRIVVRDAAGAQTWDSGEIKCSLSAAVPYKGPALKPASRYFWEVQVKDEKGEWLAPAKSCFDTALDKAGWTGSAWIAAPDAPKAGPEEKKLQVAAPGTSCFVKSVPNGKAVKAAWWTVSGLGVFEAYVNGEPVSRKLPCGKVVRDALKPGFTHCLKTRYSYTYDVTHLVKTGAADVNVFSAMVSAGWWRDQIVKYMGETSAFRAVLVLRHADGSETRVPTDLSWKAAVAGPVLAAAIFDGERYDARVGTGWMKVGEASGFKQAVGCDEFKGELLPVPGATVVHRCDIRLAPRRAYAWNGVDGAADDRFGKVKIVREYAPDGELALVKGDTLVVDFGQNAAAVPCFKAAAKAGTVLTILPAEMLNDGNGLKSRGNDGPEGSVYRKNLRNLWKNGAVVQYTFAGKGDECYRPQFTFFGYRYMSITATDDVTIKKLSSIPVTSILPGNEVGCLETGVKAVNQLISNVRWGQYSNYLSVPTDCPQRNERLGWTADTQVFCKAATFNADVYAFFIKWMRDMRDTQHADGSFTGVAPLAQYGAENGQQLGWADAGVIVPYNMWRQYGDRRVIDDNWDAMVRYVALIAEKKFASPPATTHQWADWLSYEKLESCGGGAYETGPDGKRRVKADALTYWQYLGCCYWLWDAGMMADMAKATGRAAAEKEYLAMVDSARKFLREKFVAKDGLLLPVFRDMQTPALFALKLGLLDEKAAAATKTALLKNFRDHGDCLQTGFLGTSILMDTLTYDVGAPQMAYTLLLQHKNPSWLYSVDQDATTIWERWNSYRKDTGFGPVGMNSFNHYAYGAVLAWMYGTMAGIQEDKANPGFKHFVLAPSPDSRVGHVKASFDSPYGRIESAWEVGDWDKFTWTFTIPANTTATVKVPGGETREYVAGTYTIVK
jgi:alpha-L-rhamnosidase